MRQPGPGEISIRSALWLDQEDAHEQIDARVATGRVESADAEKLHSFVDDDTGEPVVAEVGRSERLYPSGCRRHLLPDLIVRWAETPASRHRAVRSCHFGRIALPLPGNDSFRLHDHECRPPGAQFFRFPERACARPNQVQHDAYRTF